MHGRKIYQRMSLQHRLLETAGVFGERISGQLLCSYTSSVCYWPLNEIITWTNAVSQNHRIILV